MALVLPADVASEDEVYMDMGATGPADLTMLTAGGVGRSSAELIR